MSVSSYLPSIAQTWDRVSPGALHQSLDGSMVFIDISGFTAMSERLAKLGKVGAEELTAVIGSTFGELMSAAHFFGANLLKFGGDALLLFFDEEDHSQRACAAARAMRQKLTEVGACYTSAGKVVLRMTAGVHSGIFDFFCVGDSHRELVVTGPAASRIVEIESAAAPGQIVLSPETAAALPRRNVGIPVGPGMLLRGRVAAQSRLPRPAPPESADLNQFLPIGLCDLLLGGQIEPEHRPATVGFVRFQGVDGLIGEAGHEAAAGALDHLVRTVQRAVDEHGVTFLASDIATDGGKIILTAGVPRTTGHDEENMLLSLRQIVSEDLPFSLSIGVSWGPVFAGEVGTEDRRTYTVMGDVVNLAARRMAHAPSGQIYAAPQVVEGSRTTFEVTPVEPFQVKGKRFPVRAVAVGPPTGSRSGQVSGLPLIGRDEELARLMEAWSEATAGHGQMVQIDGEAGMGKSRLLEEFLASVESADVVRSECRLYQAATPYFPFRALLRQVWDLGDLDPEAFEKTLIGLVDSTAPEVGPWLPLIGQALGVEIAESVASAQLEEQYRPARLVAAVGALLEATVTRPTVFLIEDSHWMDEPSRELMAGLLAGLSPVPWLILLSRRPSDDGFVAPEGPEVTHIHLQPLGIEQTRRLIFSATEDSPLPPSEVDRLAREANGRPLFLVELLQALRRGSVDEIPVSVEAMISARIDTLPQHDRHMLRRLAVLGAGFRIEHAPVVLEADESDPQSHIRQVRRLAGFVSMDENGWVQFDHSLIRDVAYSGLPYRVRDDLHARVGDSIFASCRGNPQEFSELLSLHYFQARRWSRAWRFSRMAGDRAREIYANREAAMFYRRALEAARHLHWVTGEEKAEVLRNLAKALYEAGSYEDAIAALRKAIQLLSEDPVAVADLRLELARCYQRLGSLSQALRETALGLRLVEKSDLPDARRATARLYAIRAGLYADQFRPRLALRVGLRAVETAEASGEMQALARAYTKIDEAYQMLGLRDEARHEEKALQIYEELGDLSGITLLAINLGVQAYSDGRWDEAVALYSRAQEVSRRSGDVSAEGAAAANLGEVLISRGRFDEAEEVLQQARRVLRGQMVIGFALFAETQLGRLLLERGDHSSAVAALESVIEEAKSIGQPFFAVDASVHLADALTRFGEPERALEVIEAAEGLAGEDAALYEVPLGRLRATALMTMGRLDEARALVEPALESARAQRLLYEEALLLLFQAQLAEDGDAAAEAAHRILDDLGAVSGQFHLLPSPTL